MSLSVEAVTLRKMGNRFTYFLGILYLFSWIDRANVGIAALNMNADLKLSATMYGLGAGLFFAGYAFFEIPSNILLHKVGARRWIARIMVTWGIISTCFAFVRGPHGYYTLRFLLGVAEAGFFPGIMYYLTLWFPARHRAKPYALFLSFSMVGVMVMGPLSTGLMQICAGWMGIAGWRWMFIFEGIPAVLLGVVALFYLTDYPHMAKWLKAEEKAWLEETLLAERRTMPPVEHHSVGAFFGDKRLWALALFYFFWNLGNLGIMFWLPTILKAVGNLSNLQVGFLYSCPFIAALIGMNAVRWYSDRTGKRKQILVVCSLAAFVFLGTSGFVASPALSLLLMCLAAFNIWGLVPIFWTLPADYLGGVTAAAGIAFVSSWTGVGGFLGPYIVGLIKDATGKFPLAVLAMAVAFLIQSCIVMAMKVDRTKPKRRGDNVPVIESEIEAPIV